MVSLPCHASMQRSNRSGGLEGLEATSQSLGRIGRIGSNVPIARELEVCARACRRASMHIDMWLVFLHAVCVCVCVCV